MSIKVSIQHACEYTKEGVNIILNDISCDLGLDLTCILRRHKYGGFDALNDINIFILGLKSYSDNHAGILDFIIKWLPIYHPDARVVVMANTHTIGKLKDYLLGLVNVYAVLDNAMKLQDFRMHLRRVIVDSQHPLPPKKQQSL